jgi:PAS domain S-box-containing protein
LSNRIAELEAEVARLRGERDALAVYRLAVEHSPVGVMCMSLESGRYVFSNPAHAGFLGYCPDEIVRSDPHQRWKQITHPEDYERELDLHQRLAQGEISTFESERRCICKDGEVRWARVTVRGVRDADETGAGGLADPVEDDVDERLGRPLVVRRDWCVEQLVAGAKQ